MQTELIIKREELNLSRKSLRDFGLILAVAFPVFLMVIFPYFFEIKRHYWPLSISLVLLISALCFPLKLKFLYIGWSKIGHVLGWVNTRIILGTMYLLFFTIFGFFMRLFSKSLFVRKIDKNAKTYRVKIKSNDQKIDMELPY